MPTRAWFTSSFAAATPAQEQAWAAISDGADTLVVAPTGSGKTLAAFLWAIDRLATEPADPDRSRRCRVLYISPLKALAADVERNLRSPLVGIAHASSRLGLPVPDIGVTLRSGDTPSADRRSFLRSPTDILVTTPESLFLLLTSQAREVLRGVDTVIIDEIHAVAGTKRGAHLAVSLERLDALLDRPAQRIGLSATVRPVEEVARFLGGSRPVRIVAPPSAKSWDLSVVVPVPDLTELDARAGGIDEGTTIAPDGSPAPARTASIWPFVEERVVDLVADHRATLVFCNSRRLAERLTARLNEIWLDRHTEDGHTDDGHTYDRHTDDHADDAAHGMPVSGESDTSPGRTPAQVMAQAGHSQGAPAVLARAHHGSVSREQRLIIEDDLKSGRLPAVVATSSLELGIDMGAVDLVIQVESPPSVASGLQRIGRAGHQVGATSRGVVFPKFRGDLVQCAVVAERMVRGGIEAVRVVANPLDVLAQQIVAMAAMDDWPVDALLDLIRRTASFAALSRPVLDSVLDMLSGKYPSEAFAELRPRIVWDRATDTVSGRRGAQRLAVTSGGTIPDRGLYAVYLASGEGPGRRVGELDEEMVYESRVGDVFTLGTSTWRIEEISHDRVLVTPAPGQPGKLPFWHGDSPGRPVELGAAVGRFVREVGEGAPATARRRLADAGLDGFAADNLLAYLDEQRQATTVLPSDTTIVVERFRDEIGDWRVAIHSPFGTPVHQPWALALGAALRERFGVEVQAMAGDDGIVLTLPDLADDPFGGDDGRADGSGSGRRRPPADPIAAALTDLVAVDPDDVEGMVTEALGGSALFAARFRECAARALLLPRRDPGRRQALWQQRMRAAQLLQVAAGFEDFPIVLETVRECLQDVFDVPALIDLMRRIRSRDVRVLHVTTQQPSPFARSLVFGYVAQYLYEGDSPLAERRAAALSLDPSLLSDLLGRGESLALRDLLDTDAIARTEAELQYLTESRAARDADDLTDLVRVLGPLSTSELSRRTRPELAAQVPDWVAELVRARRLLQVRIAGDDRLAALEDAGRLRDALGCALPPGLPHAVLDPVSDPLGDLVVRFGRTHGPFRIDQVAQRYGLGIQVARDTARRLVRDGRLIQGEFLPVSDTPAGLELCDPQVLRIIRRRSIAALRADVEPVEPAQFARFLSRWQSVGSTALRGAAGLQRVVEQLGGLAVPASALESLVLPARVSDYSPALLDELMSSGEVLWCGHGALGDGDGWVSLHLADLAPYTLPPLDDAAAQPAVADPAGGSREESAADRRSEVLDLLGGGAWFFRQLAAAAPGLTEAELAATLWELVWAGRVTNDTLAPLRGLLTGGRPAHRSATRPARPGRYAGRSAGLLSATRRTGSAAPPAAAGRWTVLPERSTEAPLRALAAVDGMLDRYGILTRGSVANEGLPGGFGTAYRILSAAEDAGRVRRGYFVESLGAAQFATTAAVDAVRRVEAGEVLVLSACDPANPFGAALPWPPKPSQPNQSARSTRPNQSIVENSVGHRPGRKAGALVVIADGALVLYVERGGRTVLTFTDDPQPLAKAAAALADATRRGALGAVTVAKADGEELLGSDSPLFRALRDAGFTLTPRGLRMRRVR